MQLYHINVPICDTGLCFMTVDVDIALFILLVEYLLYFFLYKLLGHDA